MPWVTTALGFLIVCVSGMISPTAAFAAKPEFIELSGAFPYPFTATSGTIFVENATTGDTLTCTSSSTSGEISLAKKAKKVKITFEGCKDKNFGECQTNAGEKGKIITGELEGLLGYVSKPAVGLDLDPVAQPFAKFECGGEVGEWRGDIVGELTPRNTATKLYKLAFAQGLGKQEWEKLEGETKSELELWIITRCPVPKYPIGLEGTIEIKVEKETEISA
jgi:hypothetical protein